MSSLRDPIRAEGSKTGQCDQLQCMLWNVLLCGLPQTRLVSNVEANQVRGLDATRRVRTPWLGSLLGGRVGTGALWAGRGNCKYSALSIGTSHNERKRPYLLGERSLGEQPRPVQLGLGGSWQRATCDSQSCSFHLDGTMSGRRSGRAAAKRAAAALGKFASGLFARVTV